MEIAVSQFVLFFLIFLRVTALVVVAPIVGHQAVPVQVKVALGIFVALVLYPVVAISNPPVDLSFGSFVVAGAKEVATGLLIGFASGMVIQGAVVAGELISFDLGLSMASVLDPESGMQNTLMSEFLQLVMVMVFLLVNGHHFVLQTLRFSYEAAPIGGIALSQPLADRLLSIAGMTLVIGVKIAAPVIVASFLVNVALAVLTRVAPQINVFMLNFQLKIGIGYFILLASAPMMVFVFKKLLNGFEENMLELVKVL